MAAERYISSMLLAASSANDPWWATALAAANDAFTVAAIIAGGLFTYFRFVRGRTLHSDLSLTIGAEAVSLANRQALRLKVVLENTGTVLLALPLDCKQTITVNAADTTLWEQITEDGDVRWRSNGGNGVDVVCDNGLRLADQQLEPGESFVNCLLVEVPLESWVACHVSLMVEARPKNLWNRIRWISRKNGGDLVWRTGEILVANHE